jgi:hypothetical protein
MNPPVPFQFESCSFRIAPGVIGCLAECDVFFGSGLVPSGRKMADSPRVDSFQLFVFSVKTFADRAVHC